MQKVIIDTDVGDDIDDALAIAFALRYGDLDILGITTVFKNTQLRAREAKKLLSLLDAENMPVYAGYGHPLNTKCDENDLICQYTEDLEADCYAAINKSEGVYGEAAVDFIIDNTRKYNKDLTLVLIGPYTNVAKAIQKDPEAMQGVGRIVIMGGSYYEQFLEWNVLCDPEAARILFNTDIPLYCIGTDVTQKCIVDKDEYELMSTAGGTPLKDYLTRIVRLWLDASGRIPILHDPLALWAVLSSESFKFEELMVGVETKGEFTRGMTLNMDNCNRHLQELPSGHRVFIAKDVDAAAFKKVFFSTVYQDSIERRDER